MNPSISWHRAASLGKRAASLVLLVAVGSGCSGIHATKSVSPLDFLLPGLMHNMPAAPVVPGGITNAPIELEQASHHRVFLQIQPNSQL